MMRTMLRIRINERPFEFTEATKLMEVRARFKPDADLVIRNGFPASGNPTLMDGDNVVLIRKGEKPSKAELEALMMARHTPGVHDRVKLGKVGIAGLGGLGSTVAIALARVGVGMLVLADFDVVEPSNLNRQQYFVDQIGRHKTEAMEENLRRINPAVACERHHMRLGPADVPRLLAGCHVVAECFDNAEM